MEFPTPKEAQEKGLLPTEPLPDESLSEMPSLRQLAHGVDQDTPTIPSSRDLPMGYPVQKDTTYFWIVFLGSLGLMTLVLKH
jgi:hypothetical protein